MGKVKTFLTAIVVVCGGASIGFCDDGNRLAYLEENNPYYPHAGFPKLTTPQWVGEEGVEAVVILAIDDMREPAKYEAFLRPILQRLKQIDGRAPVSIMTCNVQPDDPQLASWLGEGLSLEVHTIDHPCPLLQGGDFARAKSTYDRCVDLLNKVPGNRPVAFRMPCCDSLNTVSPRFYSEIFGKTTPEGNYLQISSSVFNVFTNDDPEIPAELVTDPDDGEKFRKYLPKNLKRGDAVFNTFVNWIENYPYPYVINRLCWEFPCVVPSDWEANHLHQPNNPETVRDMQAALDITVLKQGVFCLVFHPHGWIRSEQVVELIDHAVARHGNKVKFLTFREAWDRLNRNLFPDESWYRTDDEIPPDLVLDVNNDGFMDVVLGGRSDWYGSTLVKPRTRIWDSGSRAWAESASPKVLAHGHQHGTTFSGAQFGVVTPDGNAALVAGRVSNLWNVWRYVEGEWKHVPAPHGLSAPTAELAKAGNAMFLIPRICSGVRLFDLDNDGACELVNASPMALTVLQRDPMSHDWNVLPFRIPIANTTEPEGPDTKVPCHDNGVRFVDVNRDGARDIVFSNPDRYGIWLFKDMQTGWSIEILSGKRGERPPEQELPPIVRADGSDNGFFVHSGHLFWQNEDTDTRPDLVDRRAFAELLNGAPQPGNR